MKRWNLRGAPLASVGLIVLLAISLIPGNALAQDTGKRDYEENCASCHGLKGKGDGDAVYVLPGLKPGDLTRLSKLHGGKFPAEEVYKSIDGRDEVPAHHLGARRMPLWGLSFSLEGTVGTPLERTPQGEAKAKQRITALVRYLETIQEK